jgi:hypothetical protein
MDHGITVLLDEAFIDYCPAQSLSQQATEQRNLIVFRSVTKFFAVPALRVAYVVCNFSKAQVLNRFALLRRGRFRPSRPMQSVRRCWMTLMRNSRGVRINEGARGWKIKSTVCGSNPIHPQRTFFCCSSLRKWISMSCGRG